MSDQGYLYVLANSAMPGLVKVGKTTRTPSERADELSGVTGLPTPFIVVFEQLFENCSAAEQFVHTLLESRGFRVSANREFFNAPVNDVVRAILATPGVAGSNVKTESCDDQRADSDNPAWVDVMLQAEANYYGHGDTLQDHTEALRLYKQAIKLGYWMALGTVGKMYEDGEGAPKNVEEAISYYKQGANKGDPYCYWRMALIFYSTGNNVNMTKCSESFCALHEGRLHKSILQKIGMEGMSAIKDQYVDSRVRKDFPPPIKTMFATMREPIRSAANGMIEYCETNGSAWMANLFEPVVQYVETL
jgi:hypothetical protein